MRSRERCIPPWVPVVGQSMDGGRDLEKVALRGPAATTRVWGTISGTAAVLAAVTRFLARRFQGATEGLDWVARWTKAKELGVPLVPQGVDLAPDDWVEPELMPLAPEPPPLPPAAFKHGPTPAEEAEWRVALAAAKQDTPAPETDEWHKAVVAAKTGSHPVVADEPAAPKAAEQVAKKTSTPAPRSSTPQPIRRTAELRVGPKAAAPRAVEPRITMKGAPVLAPPAEMSVKNGTPSVDPHVAAATKK